MAAPAASRSARTLPAGPPQEVMLRPQLCCVASGTAGTATGIAFASQHKWATLGRVSVRGGPAHVREAVWEGVRCRAHRIGPYVAERQRFLEHCREQGYRKNYLKQIAGV